MHNAFHAAKSNTRGEALELSIFVGPKWHSPNGPCNFTHKYFEFQGPTPLVMDLPEKHCARGRKIYRCIGNFMSMHK